VSADGSAAALRLLGSRLGRQPRGQAFRKAGDRLGAGLGAQEVAER
jgi:hypothetical protein